MFYITGTGHVSNSRGRRRLTARAHAWSPRVYPGADAGHNGGGPLL